MEPVAKLKNIPICLKNTMNPENGGTLMGMLQDAGVAQQDAVLVVDSNAVLALPVTLKFLETRSAQGGQVVQ